MATLHYPWIELSILVPLLGGLFVSRSRDANTARFQATVLAGITLVCALSGVLDYTFLNVQVAHDSLDLSSRLFEQSVFIIDQVNAPLLPLTALLFLLTVATTLRTKVRRFSFTWTLIAEAITLATFSTQLPWLLIALLILAGIPPYLELRRRGEATRVYTLHMGLFALLLIVGWSFADPHAMQGDQTLWAVLPLLGAVLIRAGIFPVHCWVTDLFERGTFGTALLFVAPISAAYATVRLIVPICPTWVLQSMGLLSLGTAVYAAGMGLVQRDARRFFAYLFLSHSALVFVGLESASVLGLAGALCIWLSVSLALCGFGLTLRALEAREGRLRLNTFQGVYEHAPGLAVCFLLTGLASVGFPATFGFMGGELLVDGVVQTFPRAGVTIVLVAALNGIAIVQVYFRLFTGTRHSGTIPLQMMLRERLAVLTLATIILGIGIYPQPMIRSRYEAAETILRARAPGALPEKSQTAEKHGLELLLDEEPSERSGLAEQAAPSTSERE